MSRIVRAIGPLVERSAQPGGLGPPIGTRPRDGFMPLMPHTEEGIRMEPPPSEPVQSGTSPAAMAAPEPPEDPPAEVVSDHGLLVAPNTVFTVSPLWPSSGVLVFPMTTQPAAFIRSTSGESRSAGAEPA